MIPTTRINTRQIPIAVHHQYKAYCAGRGYSCQRATIALMRYAVENDLELPPGRRGQYRGKVRAMNTRQLAVVEHNRFKVYCVEHGYSCQGAIIALMRLAIRTDLTLPEARKVAASGS